MKEVKFSILSLLLATCTFFILAGGIMNVIGMIHMEEALPFLFVNRFLDLPSFMIVMGGIFTNAFLIYPPHMVGKAFSYVPHIFSQSKFTHKLLFDEVDEIVSWATLYKADKLKFLNDIESKYKKQFPAYVFALVATNYSLEEVMIIGNNHIAEHQEEYKKSADLFKNMGNSGPAFGMFGTLFGLVYMLSSLDDPAKIGPGLAVGLLVTLYGVSMTHLFFYPLSKKILLNADYENLYESMILEGTQLILENKSPLFIRDKLLSNLDRKYAQQEQDKAA